MILLEWYEEFERCEIIEWKDFFDTLADVTRTAPYIISRRVAVLHHIVEGEEIDTPTFE